MAIYGTLDLLKAQAKEEALLLKGIAYLQTVDMAKIFSEVSPGNNKKIEVEGDDIFAIFQEYDSKTAYDFMFEGHKKYIDIQFVYAGDEHMHVAGIDDITEEAAYDSERDLYFPKVGKWSTFLLAPGKGCILYPDDMHSPGNAIYTPCRVKKVVVKVKVA